MTGADLEVFLDGGDLDGAVAAVGVEIRGVIRNHVLAAEFVFDGGERVLNVLHLEGEESASAGGVGDLLQSFITAQDEAAVVGGDGVNHDLGALRHFNGLGAGYFALIIFAVAEDDDGAADGTVALRVTINHLIAEFVAASAVNGIVESGAAAIMQMRDASLQELYIVSKVLRDLAPGVEAHDEGAVKVGADDMIEEADCGFLLEAEAAMDRAAGIHEQSEFDGQIIVTPEVDDFLRWFVIVEDDKIIRAKIADELAMLVSSGEEDVNFIHALFDGKNGVGLGVAA